MFFLQAAMVPVSVRYKDGVYSVPKMTMDELIVWASEVKEDRLNVQLANMEDNQRREHMSLYPPVEPDIREMGILVNTPSGIRKVLRTCLPRATGKHFKTSQPLPALTDQQIDEIIQINSTGRMCGLAWELVDIKDTSQISPYPAETNGEEDQNPTTSGRKIGSAA